LDIIIGGKMHHIIYKTTCKVTGKWYIGMHSSSSLNDNYFGSGLIICNSIKKYGKENHKRQIIAEANSREELRELEKQIVTANLIADEMCMNLASGGCGAGNGRIMTAGTRAKISASKLGIKRPDWVRQKLSNAKKGDKHPKAKTWVLLSPNDEIIRTNAMSEFCKERGLNYYSLRNRAQFNDQRPISRGDSKGWCVLACKAQSTSIIPLD
jgi:hypothetical protein